jgi:hypothetical protein
MDAAVKNFCSVSGRILGSVVMLLFLAVLLWLLYRVFFFFERDTVRWGRKKGFKGRGSLCSAQGGWWCGDRSESGGRT